VNIYRS